MLLPWLAFSVMQLGVIHNYTTSGESGIFGTAYGAIGWHKLPRNLLNLPLVLLVGLGLPAFLFLYGGVRFILREYASSRAWLCLLPLLAFSSAPTRTPS